MGKNNSTISLNDADLSGPARGIMESLLANVEPDFLQLAISGVMMILVAQNGGTEEELPHLTRDYMAVYNFGYKTGLQDGKRLAFSALVKMAEEIEG